MPTVTVASRARRALLVGLALGGGLMSLDGNMLALVWGVILPNHLCTKTLNSLL